MPDQLTDLDGRTYRLMVERLAAEAAARERS